MPGLTLFEIKCAWLNEACYNEFLARLLLPSCSANRMRAEDLSSVCRTTRTVDPVHFIPARLLSGYAERGRPRLCTRAFAVACLIAPRTRSAMNSANGSILMSMLARSSAAR